MSEKRQVSEKHSKIGRLIFVRHGETIENARGIAQGWSDSALSERGQWQVRQVAERLRTIGLTHLFCSTLPRAMTTAEVIADSVALEAIAIDDFREMNCGDWEGQSFLLVRQADPAFHQQWSSDPEVACPGGESYADVRQRIRRGLEALHERLGEKSSDAVVAIVSHGTAIRIAATEVLGLPLSFARQLAQDNTALNIFDWRTDRYVLKVWNDATHCNGSD
jgi:broad specificity phosphatase PhoE